MNSTLTNLHYTAPITAKKKVLLICPICEQKGKKEYLGEIHDGMLTVLRFHKGSTKIISRDFSVQCGGCGEVIYQRKETQHESPCFRW